MQRQMTASFEETYRRYPFAPLVGGVLWVAAALAHRGRQHRKTRSAGHPADAAGAAGRA